MTRKELAALDRRAQRRHRQTERAALAAKAADIDYILGLLDTPVGTWERDR